MLNFVNMTNKLDIGYKKWRKLIININIEEILSAVQNDVSWGRLWESYLSETQKLKIHKNKKIFF